MGVELNTPDPDWCLGEGETRRHDGGRVGAERRRVAGDDAGGEAGGAHRGDAGATQTAHVAAAMHHKQKPDIRNTSTAPVRLE